MKEICTINELFVLLFKKKSLNLSLFVKLVLISKTNKRKIYRTISSCARAKPRAKNCQQKVPILKKTKGLCPSRCYYSNSLSTRMINCLKKSITEISLIPFLPIGWRTIWPSGVMTQPPQAAAKLGSIVGTRPCKGGFRLRTFFHSVSDPDPHCARLSAVFRIRIRNPDPGS